MVTLCSIAERSLAVSVCRQQLASSVRTYIIHIEHVELDDVDHYGL